MIVRKIKEEEYKRVDELFSVSFESPYDNPKTARETIDEVLNKQESREEIFWNERYAAFEDDDKTMMSTFIISPMKTSFDGHECDVTGVGGVATLPQYRRRGGIRGCFNLFLSDCYERGCEFSYLYPFSTAYYRKFGYELCSETNFYKLNLAFIPDFKVEGYCLLCEPSENHLEEVKELQKCWEDKYNMMIRNREYEYGWIKNTNPFKDCIYTYIYRSKNDIPKAYMTFSIDEDRNLACRRFVCKDIEGFKGLLTLAKSFASDHPAITFKLPDDWYIAGIIKEWSLGAGSQLHLFDGMARVVNVKRVLEKAKYEGSGRITMAITDPVIEANTRNFSVEFTDGLVSSVEVKEYDATGADVVTSVSDFSRMIIGCLETDKIKFLDNTVINCDTELLAKVFYKKPVIILEFF